MKKLASKLLILAAIAGLAVAYSHFDLGQYFTFEFLKSQQADLQAYYKAHQARTIGLFFLIYVAVTSLSLPGAAIMTLAAGAIFGLGLGTLIVSFASTIGATLAFLAARFILRDYVQNKFGDKLTSINQGVEKDGAFYLFTLRLIPAFPFFMIN